MQILSLLLDMVLQEKRGRISRSIDCIGASFAVFLFILGKNKGFLFHNSRMLSLLLVGTTCIARRYFHRPHFLPNNFFKDGHARKFKHTLPSFPPSFPR
jgi:hypothetical protein